MSLLTDEEIMEKVIKHDYEFKALTKGMNDMVKGLHELSTSLKETISEKMGSMDKDLKESFDRVHEKNRELEAEIKEIKETQDKDGCHALSNTNNSISVLNRAMFGKDGRGGIVFDVEDMKKFIYKSMGAFTAINFAIGVVVYLFK